MTEGVIARDGRLHTACRDILSAIPGIENIDMEWSPKATPGPMVSVSFQGWSPSLHRIWTQALARMPDDIEDEDGIVDHLLGCFNDVFERQRRRAEDAALIGYQKPLPNGCIDHLHIDEAMEPLARDYGTDLRGAVHNAVGTLHGSLQVHRGGTLLRHPTMMVGETLRPGACLRFVAPSIKIRVDGRRRAAVHHGHLVTLHTEHLPETTLAAAVGRPIGSLVALHPALDGRIVRKADNDGTAAKPTIVLGIDQHLKPLGALAA